MRDLYSSLGFFKALPADVYAAAATGTTVDLLGYDAATIVLNVASVGSAGAMTNTWWIPVLQHGLASAAGVSTWSAVPASLMLHSVYGLNGSNVDSDGRWLFISDGGSGTYFIGYRGDGEHRYLRLYMSVSGAASSAWMCAIAVLGKKNLWPVNEPA